MKVDGRYVICKHLYTERRLTPLDIYLRQPEADAVEAAVLDFGNAIKDLARANIFTGDVLAKNFGVTRHGRVVSYDYDELCLLTDCSFRTIPPSNDYLEEMSAEPWYYVGENDYFPEEFSKFLGIPSQWKKLFETHHQDLFTTEFWFSIQERILSGEVIQIFPYPESKRFALQAGSSR